MGTSAIGFQVVIDAADPGALATFWAGALHYKIQDPPPGFATWPEFLTSIGVPSEQHNSASAVVDPAGVGPRIFFQQVPEAKTVKNRVHLDLNVGGGPTVPLEERRQRVDTEARRLADLGATVLRSVEERGEYHVAMRDPEGNEFDVQ